MKSAKRYFAEKTLRAILTRWPEWERFVETPKAFRKNGFWLLVPAPNPDVTRGLSVSTEPDQRMIVVGFDDDHDHLFPRKKERLPVFRQRVLHRIDDLLHDRIFAISWRANGFLRISSCFESLEPNQFVEPGFACRVRSWSGRQDRDFIEE